MREQFRFEVVNEISSRITNFIASAIRARCDRKRISITMSPWHDALPDMLAYLQTIPNFPQYGRHELVRLATYKDISSPATASGIVGMRLVPKPTKVEFCHMGVKWTAEFKPVDVDKPDVEAFTLTMHSTKKELMVEFVDGLQEYIESNSEGRLAIYKNQSGQWAKGGSIKRRNADSVFLPFGEAERAVRFAKRFFADEDRFAHLGMPWRAGMFFHGTPGSGKTSLALVIASETEKPIYVIDANDQSLTDGIMVSLLSTVPPKSVVVMDDIRLVNEGIGGEKLTMGGILAAIDGFLSSDGRITIGTTNNDISMFDPALLRCGRLGDVLVEFARPTAEQLANAWFAHFPLLSELGAVFADKHLHLPNMAAVQSLLRDNTETPQRLVR